MNINSRFELNFTFTQEEVETFAKVTGDDNPVHLDELYASSTIFKKPIIHGMLGGSVFSRILGTMFPGRGSIYLKQTFDFLRPMTVNTPYKATVELIDADYAKNKGTFSCKVVDAQTGKIAIQGEAVVMNKEKIRQA